MPYSSPRMSLGGWWGMRSSLGKSHSCQGTSATFSPLNYLVAVSSFLDVRLRDVHMSPCLLEFGVWNIKNMVSVPETVLSDTPWSSLSCIAPRGLRNISPLLPYATFSISASIYSDSAEKEAEVMQMHPWDLHTEVSWFSAASALKPAEHLMHSAFSFSSRKQNKQYNTDGNSVMFTFN